MTQIEDQNLTVTPAPADAASPHPAGSSALAHHFRSMAQQFGTAKLGMWLFLATEILMFSGLFCAYGVYRANHPEMFAAGGRLLDTSLGAINTVILITSSFTMALAVRCAQLNQRRALVAMLTLTLLGGVGFMAVKSVEYHGKWEHGLMVGRWFNPDEAYLAAHLGGDEAAAEPAAGEALAPVVPSAASFEPPDIAMGKTLFESTCSACHGMNAEGVTGVGKALRDNPFIADQSAESLVEFLKKGRDPTDPANTTGLPMPPRGGNPALNDQRLLDIAAYLKTLQAAAVDSTSADQADAQPGQDEAASADASPAAQQMTREEARQLLVPPSAIGPAPTGPAGLATEDAPPTHAAPATATVEQIRMFVSIYFLLTGLHGIHVLIGMGVLSWLIVGAARGRYSAAWFTPVEIGGLYWHLVDLIWIFLFPLLYLIH